MVSDLDGLYALVSIHAPREGRDEPVARRIDAAPVVSIHAPREGRDGSALPGHGHVESFNPRAP